MSFSFPNTLHLLTSIGVINKSAARADRIPMIAIKPKLIHMVQADVQKLAKTAEVMILVMTMATPTTRNVRRMASR